MGWSFSLGRIAGVRVVVNWTLLLLVPFAAWLLAASALPAQEPGLSRATYLAMALVATALLIVSILLHEIGHAIAARRQGMGIENVTLWFLGGLTRFPGGFPTARAELRVALAGPAVTLALGLVFGGVAAIVRGYPEVDGVAAWLCFINILLLLFNLLPAFPLDGGRVLRAALWRRNGDHLRATRTAARTGRALGAGFFALGLVSLVFGAGLDGLWIVLVAWFLIGGANAELAVADAEASLAGVRAGELMRPDPVCVTSVLSVARLLADVVPIHPQPGYPVVTDGGLVGLVLRRRAEMVPTAERAARRVEELALARGGFMEVGVGDEVGPVLAALALPPRLALVVDGSRALGLLVWSDVERVAEHARRPASGGPHRRTPRSRHGSRPRRRPRQRAGMP